MSAFATAVRRLLKDGVLFNQPVLCLLVAGLLLVDFSPLQLVARAAGQINPDSLQVVVRPSGRQISVPLQARESGGFLITMRNGERVCEEAPRALIAEVQRRMRTERLRQISSRAGAAAQPLPASGLKISLRGTAQLDQHPGAKEAFLRAAAVWEARIESPLTIVINVDFGEKAFDGNDNPSDDKPFDQDVIGVTTTQLVGSEDIYDLVRDQLINTARTPARPSLLALLPTKDLPTDLGRTTALFGPAAIFRALGIIDPVADPESETEVLGPPPAIAFNSKFAFDFDPNDGIAPGKLDFEATAVHEIGHALGFISNVGEDPSYGNEPAPIDLFRFRPEIGFSTFTTANRIQSPGGEQVLFASGTKLPLSTARPNGKDGDGSQASHWKDDVLTRQYIGIMDPSLPVGHRQMMTDNDLLAFASLGYRMRTFNRPATEELSIDEGLFYGGIPGEAKSVMVNRLTPSAYPARLEAIRIHFAQFSDLPNPTGAPIRLIAFAGPSGATTPTANPQLLIDQVVAVPPITSSNGSQAFLEFPLSGGPVITEGDFYVGFQRVNATAQNSFSGIYFDVELGEQSQRRSFFSNDNGATFSGPLTIDDGKPADALIRARIATGRGVRLGTAVSLPDREISVPLEAISKGDEIRLDFSLEFDRNILEFVRAEAADAGLTLKSNDSQLAQGRIGVSFSTNGGPHPSGLRQLARAVFRLKAGVAPGASSINFIDQPTPRAIFTITANALPATAAFTNGKVVIAETATVASAASFTSTEVAPESIAAVFGVDLAIGTKSSSSVPLPAALLGTTVEIRDSRGQQHIAPLFFVSGGQINFQVPPGAAAGTATAIIYSGDERVSLATFRIANFAPGLFAANSDGKDAAAANIVRLRNGALTYEPISRFDATQGKFVLLPIDLGPEGDQVFLVLYGSGLRFRPENSVVAGVIGGLAVPVAFLGPAGGFIGLDQVNIGPLPRALAGRGVVEVQLTIDGKTTNTVQIAFK